MGDRVLFPWRHSYLYILLYVGLKRSESYRGTKWAVLVPSLLSEDHRLILCPTSSTLCPLRKPWKREICPDHEEPPRPVPFAGGEK